MLGLLAKGGRGGAATPCGNDVTAASGDDAHHQPASPIPDGGDGGDGNKAKDTAFCGGLLPSVSWVRLE